MINYYKSINSVLTNEISKQALLVIFLIILSTLLELLGISLFIPLIIIIFKGESLDYDFFNYFIDFINFGSSANNIEVILFIFLIVFFIKNLLLTFSSIKETQFIFKTKKYLSEKLLSNYITKDSNFLNKKNSSIILNILTKEISFFVHLLINSLILISESLILISIILLMLFIETKLFLSIFGLIIIFFFIFNLISRNKIKSLANERLFYDTKFLKDCREIIDGSREIKIYSKVKHFLEEFYKTNDKIYATYWKSEIFQKIPKFWLEYFIIIFIALLIYYLSVKNFDANFIAIKLGIVGLAVARLMPSATRIFQSYQRVKIYAPSLKAIYYELSNTERGDVINNVVLKDNSLEFKNEIKIKNLNFSYNSKNKILENFDLVIKKNSIIGIYGPNGSGKSTFLDLLFGFFKPNTGEILVDDRNIYEELDNWQKKISYLPQRVYLKDSSILDNIVFDKADNKSDENLKEVIQITGLSQMLKQFPDGINSFVGDQGKKISGGQQQRIGLARALYHKPEILVMDESTNSIDYESSKQIIKTVKSMNNITRIIISHDIEILSECQEVYRLKDKKIKKMSINF